MLFGPPGLFFDAVPSVDTWQLSLRCHTSLWCPLLKYNQAPHSSHSVGSSPVGGAVSLLVLERLRRSGHMTSSPHTKSKTLLILPDQFRSCVYIKVRLKGKES